MNPYRGVSYLIIQRSDGTSDGTTYTPWGVDQVIADTTRGQCNLVSWWAEWGQVATAPNTYSWGATSATTAGAYTPQNTASGGWSSYSRWAGSIGDGQFIYALDQARANGKKVIGRFPAGHWSPDFVFSHYNVPDCGLTTDGTSTGGPYRMPVAFHPNYRTALTDYYTAIATLVTEYEDVFALVICDAASDVGSEWPTTVTKNNSPDPIAPLNSVVANYGSLALNADGSAYGAPVVISGTVQNLTTWLQGAYSQQWQWGINKLLSLVPASVNIGVGLGQIWSDSDTTELAWTATGEFDAMFGASAYRVIPLRTNWGVTNPSGDGSTFIGYGLDSAAPLTENDRTALLAMAGQGWQTMFQCESTGSFPAPPPAFGLTGSFTWGVNDDLAANWQNLFAIEVPDTPFQHGAAANALFAYQTQLASQVWIVATPAQASCAAVIPTPGVAATAPVASSASTTGPPIPVESVVTPTVLGTAASPSPGLTAAVAISAVASGAAATSTPALAMTADAPPANATTIAFPFAGITADVALPPAVAEAAIRAPAPTATVAPPTPPAVAMALPVAGIAVDASLQAAVAYANGEPPGLVGVTLLTIVPPVGMAIATVGPPAAAFTLFAAPALAVTGADAPTPMATIIPNECLAAARSAIPLSVQGPLRLGLSGVAQTRNNGAAQLAIRGTHTIT